MSRHADDLTGTGLTSRRTLIKGIVAVAGAMTVAPALTTSVARAQGVTTGNEPPVLPPIVPTGREFGPDAPPTTYFADPDVITVDPAFNGLSRGNTPIQQLWTGALWAEGPAWNSVGRYLVFSDIAEQSADALAGGQRRSQPSSAIPSNNSNGNSFDYQGRQVSAEHVTRRVVRYEHDGTASSPRVPLPGQAAQLAERHVRTHPDGSIWFTDPP